MLLSFILGKIPPLIQQVSVFSQFLFQGNHNSFREFLILKRKTLAVRFKCLMGNVNRYRYAAHSSLHDSRFGSLRDMFIYLRHCLIH